MLFASGMIPPPLDPRFETDVSTHVRTQPVGGLCMPEGDDCRPLLAARPKIPVSLVADWRLGDMRPDRCTKGTRESWLPFWRADRANANLRTRTNAE